MSTVIDVICHYSRYVRCASLLEKETRFMDDDFPLIVICVECEVQFHRRKIYHYNRCAVCDPRVPHPLDEAEFEERSAKLLEEMEAEELFLATVQRLDLGPLEDLLPLFKSEMI